MSKQVDDRDDIVHCAADPRRAEDEECDERDESAGFLADVCGNATSPSRGTEASAPSNLCFAVTRFRLLLCGTATLR
jgi:hypothetical protein